MKRLNFVILTLSLFGTSSLCIASSSVCHVVPAPSLVSLYDDYQHAVVEHKRRKQEKERQKQEKARQDKERLEKKQKEGRKKEK